RRLGRPVGYGLLLLALVAIQQRLAPIPALRDMHAIAVHRPEYMLAAHIYAHDGQFDLALAELERLQARAAPRRAFVDLARLTELDAADYRVRWAIRLLAQGKLDESRQQADMANRAYAARPDLGHPFYDLGLLYLRLGDPAKARACLERFFAHEPVGP